MKILYIEDEESLRKPVKKYLEQRSFIVDEAEDGRSALSLIHINNYDCILLDLNLPEIDGIEVIKQIREEDITTPVIMVTARSQIYNKLEGFKHGTDDYITKPFDLNELVARISALIKRSSKNNSEKLILGNWEIDTEINTATYKNTVISLTTKEVSILEYLLRNKGRAVTTEELLEHIWDENTDFLSQTVKTHIKTIRQKLDPKKEFITTIKGKGYYIPL